MNGGNMADDDASEQKPEAPAIDLNEVDPEASVLENVEQIQADAKRTHSLADTLKGIKHRHTRILLFKDPAAADEYRLLNDEAQRVNDQAANTKDEAIKASLIERYNALEVQLEAAQERMLQSALAVEMRAFPNIAQKVARRKAMNAFRDPITKQIPQEKAGEFAEMIDLILIGDSIQSITDVATKTQLELGPREDLGKMLSDLLPSSQWQRLFDAFINLTLTDELGDAAVRDVGF
jgi:hypothetical protein